MGKNLFELTHAENIPCNDVKTNIWKKVGEMIRANGCSQKFVAEKIGMNATQLSRCISTNYTDNSCDASQLYVLSRLFDVSMEELCGDPVDKDESLTERQLDTWGDVLEELFLIDTALPFRIEQERCTDTYSFKSVLLSTHIKIFDCDLLSSVLQKYDTTKEALMSADMPADEVNEILEGWKKKKVEELKKYPLEENENLTKEQFGSLLHP